MKYSIVILLALIFASCHNYKKDAEQLQTELDSIENVATQRNADLEAYQNDFNEIQAHLDSLKKNARAPDELSETEGRAADTPKGKILADIAFIEELLDENQELITSLQQKFTNSSQQTGKLESMVEELEKQSKELEQKLEQKESEANGLSQQVDEQSESISQLKTRLNEIEELSALQADSLKRQDVALNTAYYKRGTAGDLKDEGIVEREGGILGIGSTVVMRDDFDRESFTTVDIREFNSLPLNVRKVDIVSVHPEDSYHITGTNGKGTLEIDDPREFWSASKYLVLVVK